MNQKPQLQVDSVPPEGVPEVEYEYVNYTCYDGSPIQERWPTHRVPALVRPGMVVQVTDDRETCYGRVISVHKLGCTIQGEFGQLWVRAWPEVFIAAAAPDPAHLTTDRVFRRRVDAPEPPRVRGFALYDTCGFARVDDVSHRIPGNPIVLFTSEDEARAAAPLFAMDTNESAKIVPIEVGTDSSPGPQPRMAHAMVKPGAKVTAWLIGSGEECEVVSVHDAGCRVKVIDQDLPDHYEGVIVSWDQLQLHFTAAGDIEMVEHTESGHED